MRLNLFESFTFERGASPYKEAIWLAVGGLVSSWVPGSAWRAWLLRRFGSRIGEGVVIKPRVRVKFPWRLVVGDHCWIGEGVWIDNLAKVNLGDHVCVSQGVYLCTGSHDWGSDAFDLIVKPISIESHSWLGAMSRVAPGVSVAEGAVLSLGGVATRPLESWAIHSGNPATVVKKRPKCI